MTPPVSWFVPQRSGGPLRPILAAYAAPADADDAEEDDYSEFDPYLFIQKLPPLSSVVSSTRAVLLPRQVRGGYGRPQLLGRVVAQGLCDQGI